MRKFFMIVLFCLIPTQAFAQGEHQVKGDPIGQIIDRHQNTKPSVKPSAAEADFQRQLAQSTQDAIMLRKAIASL